MFFMNQLFADPALQSDFNNKEIGQELNIQRESATRLLKKPKEVGYIDISRGEVTLLKSKINKTV